MISKISDIARAHNILGIPLKIMAFVALFIIAIKDEALGALRKRKLGGDRFKSLEIYKDIHNGERCFIIATGPGLTIEDIDSLKNEYTFGMNSIVKKYGDTNFRPTYYGIQDHIVYKALEAEISDAYKGCSNVFVSDRIGNSFLVDKAWHQFPLFVAYHSYQNWFKDNFKAKFSDDIHRRVYDGFSITISLLEIAVYMGFKEIYLIGADCSYLKNKVNHFAEHGVVDRRIDTAAARNLAGYEAAKKYADEHGIKIYNATRGGELEVFERVDIDKMKLK